MLLKLKPIINFETNDFLQGFIPLQLFYQREQFVCGITNLRCLRTTPSSTCSTSQDDYFLYVAIDLIWFDKCCYRKSNGIQNDWNHKIY
jgi:hypothetical protein